MAAVLVGVSGQDPRLYAALVVSLAVVALLAAAIPLRRAVRIEPMIALRED